MNSTTESRVQGEILLTVLMPCLNEANTIAACIQQAHAGCRAALATSNIKDSFGDQSIQSYSSGIGYEILIADNGSVDGSQKIALDNSARVIPVKRKGYGVALREGIAAARGSYIVMGDSDCSYDFGAIESFLYKLLEGNDLVMGNRFTGGIKPGAMPWHHRYIGNPLLSSIGRILYRAPCRDWHCGLRAFRKECISSLELSADGMEFASEMIIASIKANLRVSEIPVVLYPDERGRPPHLRSIRDGLRHLRILISSFELRRIVSNTRTTNRINACYQKTR